MAAVGRARYEWLGAKTQKVVFAHQPENALGVDNMAFAPQLRGDPAIAVVSTGQADPLDMISHIRVRASWLIDLEAPIVAGARDPAQSA
jgi:hypothetical protein